MFRDKILPSYPMYRLALIILLFAYYSTAYCQDISGKWEGNYGKNLTMNSLNVLEVNIEIYDDSLVRGTSYLKYNKDNHEKYAIAGVYRKADSTIYFKEEKELSVMLNALVKNVMGNYTMKLRTNDTSMRFEGKWKENGEGILNFMASKVWLEKPLPPKPKPAEPKIEPLPEPKPVVIKEKKTGRATHIQKVFEIEDTERDSIRIEITDNARIDGDIVTVYVNDIPVAEMQKLTAEPIVFHTSVSKASPKCVIKLAAESYGSMPPCTAQMIILTKKGKYTTNVESNYNSNGAVVISLRD